MLSKTVWLVYKKVCFRLLAQKRIAVLCPQISRNLLQIFTVQLFALENMSCSLKEVNGDLFSANESFSMAHCVAADLKMGKGIAIQFRNKFGRIHALQQQNVKPGGVAILTDKSRFIYNLVTKPTSWGKPTYQTLHCSLSAMREHMLKNSVTELAMPRIGCGLDGLSWPKVKDLIEKIFEKDLVTIVIYNYTPSL